MDEEGEGDTAMNMGKEKTAAEIRKSNKPLMEKRRRERINNCLDQLKSILMEVTKKESSYYSKLEKADILEMTVKYLKNLKRQQLAVAMASDPSVLSKYVAGYNECTTEISKYLNNVDSMTPDVRARMLNHLANSLQRTSTSVASSASMNLQYAVNNAVAGNTNQQFTLNQGLAVQFPSATPLTSLPGSGGVCVLSSGPAGNNTVQTIPASPMQLVPAKLPSGDTVYLLTNPQTLTIASGSGTCSNFPNQNQLMLSPTKGQLNIAPMQSTPQSSVTPGVPNLSPLFSMSPPSLMTSPMSMTSSMMSPPSSLSTSQGTEPDSATVIVDTIKEQENKVTQSHIHEVGLEPIKMEVPMLAPPGVIMERHSHKPPSPPPGGPGPDGGVPDINNNNIDPALSPEDMWRPW